MLLLLWWSSPHFTRTVGCKDTIVYIVIKYYIMRRYMLLWCSYRNFTRNIGCKGLTKRTTCTHSPETCKSGLEITASSALSSWNLCLAQSHSWGLDRSCMDRPFWAAWLMSVHCLQNAMFSFSCCCWHTSCAAAASQSAALALSWG
jgi:hypothetical protein